MAKVFLRAYNREIEAMIDRGQLDEAIAHCHHIMKTFPKHLETYRLLGKAYLEGKRYGDAVDVFSRVIASVPNDFVSHVGLSIIRDEENKLDDAIWHMERAFETQPSNAAIQSELQRLYGRRDGVQPPRIRMTRGALAHMYVQGELYPQAISEIKSVLKEDPGRSDMQSLLARAYFKSGAKNDAVDAALALLQRYPYALDANRVLTEVLSADRNENAQAYRQRVVELDPYAAQVSGSVFQSNEVADAAVSLERLDWNGQPVGMQSNWSESQAIGLVVDKASNEQPDWLKSPFGETTPPVPSQSASAFTFDTPDSPQAAPAQPADEIPDFLKAAGWGESTGAFDESKSMFASEELAAPVQPLAEGDLPDWVKAMKPAEPESAGLEEEEELPDWINKIGTGALGTSDAQPDWLNQPEETQQPFAAAAEDQPDWLKGFDTPQESAQPTSDQPDWLEGIGTEPDLAPQPAQSDTPDWLKGLGSESDIALQAAQTDAPDWLKGFGSEAETPPIQSASVDDWMKQLTSQPAESAETPSDFDFLNELAEEPVAQATEEPAQPITKIDELGKTEQERDDSFAWLENLAAKQGASEGLLTTPEERLEEEPEWIRQAKGLTGEPPAVQPPVNAEELGKSEQERDDSFAWLEDLATEEGASEGVLSASEDGTDQVEVLGSVPPSIPAEPPVSEPAASIEEPGTSEQEQDDSFAWLEDLAATQGASEGLPTSPEERLEEVPDWVKQAMAVPTEPPAVQPAANVEDLGKSEQERDDSFAWLENLAAKQGASEGLLTKPEERMEQEPEWVRQAKNLSMDQPVMPEPQAEPEAAQQPAMEQPAAVDETAVWLNSLQEEEQQAAPAPAADETAIWLQKLKQADTMQAEPEAEQPAMEQPAAVDETAAWVNSLQEEEQQAEPAPAADETALWLQKLEQADAVPAEPAPEPVDADMPAWMKNIDQEESPSAEPTLPAQEAESSSTEPELEGSAVPSWLSDLDKEESVITPSNEDDLPAWLRDETGEVVAEPVKIEPTRPTDWKPVEESSEPEILQSPPLEEPKEPRIIYSPPLEETKAEPEPEEPLPVAAIEEPDETPVPPPKEEPKPEPVPARKAPSRPAPATEPRKEPVTRKGAGILVTPGIDPMLGSARSELSRSNIPGALESYGRLIKKGRFLDEVIYDLREALYRYPVEVSIWQSLGDAYMRANRLQDALDAYTKAEELLR